MATTSESTLGNLAQSAIARYLKQATHYEKSVLADTDSENLHQMRVGLRRLRTALQVFAPAIQMPAPAESAQVGKVARKLGRLRDLDVVAETLEQRYLPDLPEAEQTQLAEVLEQLSYQRRQRFKSVKHLLQGKRYKQLKASFNSWLQAPALEAIADWPALQAVPDLVLPLASQTWLHPGWLVGTKITRGSLKVNTRIKADQVDALIHEQSETLHDLRKQLKRLRYQLKVVSDLYGEALDPDLERLALMQDTLGSLQDSLVIDEVLADAVRDPRKTLPTLLALMADQRHRSWKNWQSLQQHYIDANNRIALRQLLAAPSAAQSAEAKAPIQTAAESQDEHGDTRQKSAKDAGTRRKARGRKTQ